MIVIFEKLEFCYMNFLIAVINSSLSKRINFKYYFIYLLDLFTQSASLGELT